MKSRLLRGILLLTACVGLLGVAPEVHAEELVEPEVNAEIISESELLMEDDALISNQASSYDNEELFAEYVQQTLEEAVEPEETELLASFGYYYHLQLYLTRNDKNAGRLAIPADVRSSARESAFLHDMEMDVVSVVKK